MGDRANVVVQDGDETVCLYTHWAGSELPQTLRDALRRGRERWNDAQYLTRIIFCEMVKDNVMGLTGYGISATPRDGENRILYVNVDEQTVTIRDDAYACIPFAAYVGMDDVKWWPGEE